MKRNGLLKAAIFNTGKSQRSFAREIGIPESVLSMAINGRLNFRYSEKVKIANALGKPVTSLFQNG